MNSRMNPRMNQTMTTPTVVEVAPEVKPPSSDQWENADDGEDGKVLTVDVEAATHGLIEGQRKRLKTVPQRDWAGRTADQLAPPVYGTKERLPQSRPVT